MATVYDRVLYQLGNTSIHKYMFELIEKVPGVVVLHDFFLSELQARRGKKLFLRALKESHGYGAVMEHLSLSGGKVPANLAVIQSAQGVVVHSEELRDVASQWYGDGAGDEFEVIPFTIHAIKRHHRPTRRSSELPWLSKGCLVDL